MKRTDDNLSIWLDADTRDGGDTDAVMEPGTHTLNELVDLADCFDLLERVWPTPGLQGAARASGDVIGPYTLVREIGHGGMGTVWEATQEVPLQRRLAIKFVNSENSGERILQRFDAERNLLARMDHPGIARVLDAGTDDDARPWFAMELVEGQDIVSFCRDQVPSLEERLRLFVDVCDAVQHAHQKGVIHRDIKSSNVLVQTVNGRPEVKVIDFGLARAMDRDEFEVTAETRSGAILGSLWHMSPEQTISGADVDTRTDVYLLGGLLYRILTGEYLLDRAFLESQDLAKILIAIQEQQPPRPSVRVRSAEKSGDSIERLPAFRGELDWVVMRAIEKEPSRRYSTVAELAVDVQRFLHDEPLVARPPSAMYLATKYVRRHKTVVFASAAVLFAILSAAVVATIGYVRVSDANEDAERRLKQARASTSILSDIFADLDIREVDATTKPLRMQLAERLVTASEKLDPDSLGDPVEVAKVQLRLGQTLNHLSFFEEAVPVCTQAYEASQKHVGNTRITRDAGRALAVSLMSSDQYRSSRELLLRLIDDSESRGDERELLETQHLLARSRFLEGDWDAAQVLVEQTIAGRARLLGDDDLETLESKIFLAQLHASRINGHLAIPILEECVEVYREKLPGNSKTIGAIGDLAWAYCQTPQRMKGVALADEAYALSRQTFGEQHEVTLNALSVVGMCAASIGETERAITAMRKAVDGLKATGSRDDRSTGCCQSGAGSHLSANQPARFGFGNHGRESADQADEVSGKSLSRSAGGFGTCRFEASS